jgi:hypothetical protein
LLPGIDVLTRFSTAAPKSPAVVQQHDEAVFGKFPGKALETMLARSAIACAIVIAGSGLGLSGKYNHADRLIAPSAGNSTSIREGQHFLLIDKRCTGTHDMTMLQKSK